MRIDTPSLLCGTLALIVGAANAQSDSRLCGEKASEIIKTKFGSPGYRSGLGDVTCPEYLLNLAIRFQDLALVELALRLGASAGSARNPFSLTPDKGDSPPLYIAVLSNANPQIVKALVAGGADVNARYSPDIYAAAKPQSFVDRLMLSHLYDQQETGQFPLYDAAMNSNPAVVEQLILLGADVRSVTGTFLRTALFATDNVAIGEVLIRHGVEINKKDRDGATVLSRTRQWLRDTPMESAFRARRERKEAFVAWLLSKGAQD